MILQALCEYYEVLAEKGEIAQLGWSSVKVSFALCLSSDGRLERIADLRDEKTVGKKTAILPQDMNLPTQCKRSSGIAANFLCDNSGYMLGIDDKGKPQRTRECFEACRVLHEEILKDCENQIAKSILAFFEAWNPEAASENPMVSEYIEDILAGGNLIFRVDGKYAHDDPEIRCAWERYYNRADDGDDMVCLVTGERGAVEKLHPSIKNVVGAQSSGASLVSFNAPAFCSYGKEQSLNAPTGKYAVFAYTSVLNKLLSDRETVFRIGDMSIVCWAKDASDVYQSFFKYALTGDEPEKYTDKDLIGVVESLCRGQAVNFDEKRLDPDMEFYILGLAPNAARLSVRFFLRNSFGEFLRNCEAHQNRLEIVKPSFDTHEQIPLWRLLSETVNQNSRDKSPAPQMAGETLRAILNNNRYPATLLNNTMLRITAEREVTRGRAAIIKAYYLQNPNSDVPKEVLSVSLNQNSNNVPYVLGRLFSVLESIQEAANPGINATIKDKYFNSASSTPALIFPGLIDLAQKHLRKLDGGLKVYYEKQLGEIFDIIGTEYPTNLNLPMKGSFQLGYYHQTQERYKKKEDK